MRVLTLEGGVHSLIMERSRGHKEVLDVLEVFMRLHHVGDCVFKAVGEDVFVNEGLILLGSLQEFRGIRGCLPLSLLHPRWRICRWCILMAL